MIEEEKSLDEDEQEILQNLGKFIKHNSSLLQLDLSHTQLRANLLRELVTCLRRAQSLLTLDISGNPGVSDELRAYLERRVHCRPDPLDLERLCYVQADMNDVNKAYDEKNNKNEKILDSMEVRNIREVTSTKFTNRLTNVRTYQANENLIYQRILGHKDDMPGSGQWIETSTATAPPELLNDWITNKSIYTLVFWSKNLAKEATARAQYSRKEMARIMRLLRKPDVDKIRETCVNMKNKLCPLPYYVNGELTVPKRQFKMPPLLAGSLNNWQYAPMYKIEDFVAMLDRRYEDPIKALIDRGELRDNLEGEAQMSKMDLQKYLRVRLKMEQEYKRDWLSILMNRCSRYKAPYFINFAEFEEYPPGPPAEYDERKTFDLLANEALRQNPKLPAYTEFLNLTDEDKDPENQLWVGVALSRPGRHTYIVKYEEAGDHDCSEGHKHALGLVRKFTSLDSVGQQLMDQSPLKAEDHDADARARCSFHRCIIQAREEEVPPFAKVSKSKVRVRVFCREESVFADWKVDTDAMLKTAFRADRENWKLDRFIRDPDDL